MTEKRHSISTIVACVDSPEAHVEKLIHQAVFFSSLLGARLVLLHVSSPHPDFVGYDAGPQSVRDSTAKTLRTEHHALQSLAEAVRNRGIDCLALSVPGDTAEQILLEVKKLRADMLIATIHRHGLLYRLIYGDLMHAVMKTLTCPVLLIPD
jgi:nucleotide-binding universal stress UspA family protein